jgi:phage regulator Rha-like protein
MAQTATALAKKVETKILVLRSHKVILDTDLAQLYGVSVKRLNQQVTRNKHRFPADFIFRLSRAEHQNLRLQFATSSSAHGGSRYFPNAFTEHGAIMATTVLKSQRAIQMSIFVVRAFVRMREALAQNQQIMSKLSEIEKRLENHETDIGELVRAVRQLMVPPEPQHRKIGFAFPTRAQTTASRARIAV